jgi:hypothetical protein
MSVRAWFSISAAVLVVLIVAFVFRFFAPVPAPEIVARVGGIRLTGQRDRDCWPQRNGDLRCAKFKTTWTKPARLHGTGTMHVVVTYPVQPPDGMLTFTKRDGTVVLTKKWTETVPYDLPPGSYALRADASYPKGAYVKFYFALTVTSAGS